MSNYLTIKQAAAVTGRSDRQIRRLCYDAKSKDFVTHDEKGRLLVDANYLAQHYPLVNTPQFVKQPKNDIGKSIDISNGLAIDNVKEEVSDNLQIKVALLEQEVRQKNEIISIITQEKDKRIEVLERALLLLGEGQKKEVSQENNSLPEKKIPWWRW
jgi:hypothetical protein